jgi:hypothetical protein
VGPGLRGGPLGPVGPPGWQDLRFGDSALLIAGCVDTDDLRDPGRFDCGSAPQPCPLWEWASVGVEAGGTQVRVRFRENRQVVLPSLPWDHVLDGRWLEVEAAPHDPDGRPMCARPVTVGV